ncbi:hypothetical protein RFI_23735 [Reticulomyxa filosa]|uniref:Uncharacterized protein n=1 Tax=Reticulomyxa filosa TaxID=46433 RepID=X6MKM5_RETFI|nr:hypothetical protein RFI_23735 [Reticulomyxa filosa]|eukprot:ETO13635.1 hypothetical protein RFI_23735 [Reticulomyxa filosa]
MFVLIYVRSTAESKEIETSNEFHESWPNNEKEHPIPLTEESKLEPHPVVEVILNQRLQKKKKKKKEYLYHTFKFLIDVNLNKQKLQPLPVPNLQKVFTFSTLAKQQQIQVTRFAFIFVFFKNNNFIFSFFFSIYSFKLELSTKSEQGVMAPVRTQEHIGRKSIDIKKEVAQFGIRKFVIIVSSFSVTTQLVYLYPMDVVRIGIHFFGQSVMSPPLHFPEKAADDIKKLVSPQNEFYCFDFTNPFQFEFTVNPEELVGFLFALFIPLNPFGSFMAERETNISKTRLSFCTDLFPTLCVFGLRYYSNAKCKNFV